MKTISLILILFGFVCHGQQKELVDTIYSNQFYNVALFFPSTIQQGIVGHENFTFSYNKNVPQHLGLLKAFPGTESNLLVITSDGNIYSYLVKYAEEIPQFTFFIQTEASIGKENGREEHRLAIHKPLALKVIDSNKQKKKKFFPEEYYQNVSRYLLRTKVSKNLARNRDSKVVLKLKDLSHRGDKTFVVLEIANRSTLDFRLDYLEVYFASGNNGRKSSYQRIVQQPLYSYCQPEIVRSKSKIRFVLVLPKFAPGKNRHLELQIGEKTGGRTVKIIH